MKDLADPRLDVRLRRLLERLLVDHPIHVRLVATGHSFGPTTPNGQPNDHFPSVPWTSTPSAERWSHGARSRLRLWSSA
jgi:hypothetical protein